MPVINLRSFTAYGVCSVGNLCEVVGFFFFFWYVLKALDCSIYKLMVIYCLRSWFNWKFNFCKVFVLCYNQNIRFFFFEK